MDALWFGCIPVFLADHYVPPLFDLIHWDAVSISIPENQVVISLLCMCVVDVCVYISLYYRLVL